MIDGIKLNINNKVATDWIIKTNEETGEILPNKTALLQGFVIVQKGNRVTLKGSLHKYHNNGLHNYNDFTFEQLVNGINDLKRKYNIDPETSFLENVEFGVNIETPFDPEYILNNVVIHKGEPFKRFPKGLGVECEHAQFFIKIYDKGAQFNISGNLLRVEVKVIKMAYFKSQNLNLVNLADLTNRDLLNSLGELLTKTVNEILFTNIDLLNNSSISEADRLILSNGSNPNYWNNLKPNSTKFELGNTDPAYKRERKKYYRELAKFEKLLTKYDNGLKTLIVERVRDKFTDLLNKTGRIGQPKKRDKFTDPEQKIKRIEHPKEENEPDKGTKLPLVYSVSLSPRYCPITHLDISMQKPNSKFLSIAGIKHYYVTQPIIYKELEKRLTDKWKFNPVEVQIREIAHSIRNEYYNPKHNYKRDSNKRGAKLFDDTPYFSDRLKDSIFGNAS